MHVSLFLVVNVSEVVALVNVVVWTRWLAHTCQEQSTLDSGGHLSRGQRRGHEHTSEGAAVVFSEDGRLRNGLLHYGAGV